MTATHTLQQLLQIHLALSESSPQDVLELIAADAAKVTGSDSALLLLLDASSGDFYVASSIGRDVTQNAKIPFEGSLAGWILRHHEPRVLEWGAPELEVYVECRVFGDQTTQNMAAVPVETRGRVLGVLEVIDKRVADGYSKQDVRYLRALAALAALAGDNAQLLQQTDLIAEFMHEVKTPLMALTAASELLARDSHGQKQVELIEMIQKETMRLANMTQDFLDLTRLESGRARIAREPVDLAEIIYDVVRLQEPQAAARYIEFFVTVEDDLPPVSGDYDRLRQVFLNLTSNAIKYNEDHGRIIISMCKIGEEAQVEITDTGPGIATENLPHLFERFYRIPDSEGFTKGTGLGLSIAARLIREHGGRIEVQSELGQGSTFRCYLPLQA